MTLKASEIKIGDTFDEVLVEDLKITTTNQKGDVVVMGNATGRVDP